MVKNNEDFDNEEELPLEEEQETPVTHDYTDRRILLWEEDEVRRTASLEFLTDLLSGAEIEAVATEAEALEALDNDDWDTFVVDFMDEGVSNSEFVKRANNYPASIVVAVSLAFLELEERDPVKLEQIRRLFDVEKNASPIRA